MEVGARTEVLWARGQTARVEELKTGGCARQGLPEVVIENGKRDFWESRGWDALGGRWLDENA